MTSANAWDFYYTYNILYQLRYKGEEAYKAMCNVKGLASGLAKKGISYTLKQQAVDNILSVLDEECQFILPENVKMPEAVSYQSKMRVECPVDVEVLDANGNVVVHLSDQVGSDVTNEHGRFAVVYTPYTGNYAKMLCFSQDQDYTVRSIGTDAGLVNMTVAKRTQNDDIVIYKMDNERVEKDTVLSVRLTEEKAETGTLSYTKETSGSTDIEEKYMRDSTDATEVAVTSVRLKEDNITLNVGESCLLNATVIPSTASDQQLCWLSEDNSIATVKEGKVLAVKEGKIKIYCSSLGNPDIMAVCDLSVAEKKPSASIRPVQPTKTKAAQKLKVRYGPSKKKLKKPLGSKLTQKVTGAKTKVTFTSSDPKVARVNKKTGKITCVGVGNAVITTTAEASSKYKEAKSQFKLTVVPKKVDIYIRSKKKGRVIVQISAQNRGNSGYQIKYKNRGITKIAGIATSKKYVRKTLKNLRSSTMIMVRVRAYKKVGGKTIFGPYTGWAHILVK